MVIGPVLIEILVAILKLKHANGWGKGLCILFFHVWGKIIK
jgi:hypothetical protein